jgi:hypothetical protein
MPSDMPPWVLHDLRRTARSLLSWEGVRPDISERVLGHAIGGVEGVYDRHHYTEERAKSLQALADKIASIVDPPLPGAAPPLPMINHRQAPTWCPSPRWRGRREIFTPRIVAGVSAASGALGIARVPDS